MIFRLLFERKTSKLHGRNDLKHFSKEITSLKGKSNTQVEHLRPQTKALSVPSKDKHHIYKYFPGQAIQGHNNGYGNWFDKQCKI